MSQPTAHGELFSEQSVSTVESGIMNIPTDTILLLVCVATENDANGPQSASGNIDGDVLVEIGSRYASSAANYREGGQWFYVENPSTGASVPWTINLAQDGQDGVGYYLTFNDAAIGPNTATAATPNASLTFSEANATGVALSFCNRSDNTLTLTQLSNSTELVAAAFGAGVSSGSSGATYAVHVREETGVGAFDVGHGTTGWSAGNAVGCFAIELIPAGGGGPSPITFTMSETVTVTPSMGFTLGGIAPAITLPWNDWINSIPEFSFTLGPEPIRLIFDVVNYVTTPFGFQTAEAINLAFDVTTSATPNFGFTSVYSPINLVMAETVTVTPSMGFVTYPPILLDFDVSVSFGPMFDYVFTDGPIVLMFDVSTSVSPTFDIRYTPPIPLTFNAATYFYPKFFIPDFVSDRTSKVTLNRGGFTAAFEKFT